MDLRPARLRTLTLALAASVLLTPALRAAAEEAPATPPAPGGTVYNVEIIVFRATSTLGGEEEESP